MRGPSSEGETYTGKTFGEMSSLKTENFQFYLLYTITRMFVKPLPVYNSFTIKKKSKGALSCGSTFRVNLTLRYTPYPTLRNGMVPLLNLYYTYVIALWFVYGRDLLLSVGEGNA